MCFANPEIQMQESLLELENEVHKSFEEATSTQEQRPQSHRGGRRNARDVRAKAHGEVFLPYR